jgi:histidinol-phosphate aminotransferase
MDLGDLSRRRFTGALGAALGSALLAPRAASRAEASLPRGYSEDYVQLNSNENPYGPSPAALEAMTRALASGARYPDAPEDEMIDAIARLHGVDPKQVILGCGSGEVLRMADMAFLEGDRKVVVAEPTFEAVLAYARVTKAEPVKVPLNATHRHDLDAMARACDERTGLVYVCNPNNPTGTIVPAEALAAFVARVPPTATVVIDEAYHHFVESPGYRSALELLGKHPNVLVVRTFSKIHGLAGMRLGYGVGSEELVRALRRHAFASNANAAVLAAGLASLGDFAHEAGMRKRMNDTRRWLYRELDRDGRRYIPSEANFTMIELGTDVKPVIEAFRERRILVGRRFPSLPTWLRVSIGTEAETAAFVTALRGIVPARAAA